MLVLAEKTEDGTLFEVEGDPFEDFASTFETENGRFLAWKVPEENGDRLVELHGDVRFTNVVFSYVPGHVVLDDVSLYAKPGQKIAFCRLYGRR